MDSLADILTLECLNGQTFRSDVHRENFRQTLFGGQVLSQALMAASQTVEGKAPHSLHAYFLRAGSSTKPVIYQVINNRNGRSFDSRTVNAVQNDQTIFTLSASFHLAEKGFEHQHPCPEVPSPEDIIDAARAAGPNKIVDDYDPDEITGAFKVIPVGEEKLSSRERSVPNAKFWFKIKDAIPDCSIYHSCALAFASDLGILATSLLPHPAALFSPDIFAATLDHAMWFHDPELRTDDWLLYSTYSPWSGGARGYAQGRVYNRDRKLVASITQEGLIRPVT